MMSAAAGSGGGEPEGAWDLSFAYYDPPEGFVWNISSAVFHQKFSVADQELVPNGIFFKPDGTKMYVVGSGGDDVNEYDLSTAWDISTSTFLQLFSVAAQEIAPQGIFFKPDGTKMYVVGFGGDYVNEYDLSTAWDISTSTFLQLFSVAAQETAPTGIFFKPDGTKMYVVGSDGDEVNEYNLSTAWDISTSTFRQRRSVAPQETAPQGLFFKPDGTKMYVVGSTGDDVNEYDLSTAWDISTSTFLQLFSVAAQETDPQGIFFKPDGTKMYVVGSNGDEVNEYNLGGFSVAAQEIAPQGLFFKPDGLKMYVIGQSGDAVHEYGLNASFSVAAQETAPTGIFFKPDGTKMYVIGAVGDSVYEYDLSTAWVTGTASFLQLFSVADQELVPQDIFFKPDGLKMYVVGSNGEAVYEYDLSTAWDISTSTFLQLFSVAAQETNPRGIFFKPDGLKMYVVGFTGDDVNEYDLSTAWDISTSTFLQTRSVAIQETFPNGIFFKPDGTKMYVVGSTGDDVNEYDLSTAWDISTSTFLQLFSVAAQETNPQGIFFKPDGTKMYVVGSDGHAVHEYDLSTAWDVSTASFVSIGYWDISTAVFLQSFSVAAQETFPQGLFFKPDGTKMYVVGSNGDDVNEYDLSTAWDISTSTFLQLFSVAAQQTAPTGILFKPDGLKMYVVGSAGDYVNQYDLRTAWDISTSCFLQSFSVAVQEAVPNGIFFKPDGTKMYVVGSNGDDVNEYDLRTAWDISTSTFLQLFSVAAQETAPTGIFFKPDGTKMFIVGLITDAVYSYTLGPQD
jgi:DNA-binding beta-propeller fold protein YncE